MWNLTNGKAEDWGIRGYKIQKKYLDPIKIHKGKENYLYATNKKKRPSQKKVDLTLKRGTILEKMTKKSQSLPAPWNYDISLQWGKVKIPEENLESTKKSHQLMKFKWKGTGKENQNIIKFSKLKQKKIDKSVKKHSYIDKIINDNTKKDYPVPGPADFFFDEKGIKKFRKDNFDLFYFKNDNNSKKTILPLEKRNFIFSKFEKNGKNIPAPGYCNPNSKNFKKPEERGINYKKFKDRIKEKKNYQKEKLDREKERLNHVKEKVNFNINQLNKPIPPDYNTFDKLAEKYKEINRKKKTWGFGVGSKIPEAKHVKWKKKMEIKNTYAEKKIDLKKDPTPGPAHYSLISHWKGKTNKKNKEKLDKLPHHLSKLSKGPVINAYYRKY